MRLLPDQLFAETLGIITGCGSDCTAGAAAGSVPAQPNIERAEQLLAWRPQIQWREGLERTVVYFSQRIATRRLQEVTAAAMASD